MRGRLCASSVCRVPLLQLLTLLQLSLTRSPRDCVAVSLQPCMDPILHGDLTCCSLLPACLPRWLGAAVVG